MNFIEDYHHRVSLLREYCLLQEPKSKHCVATVLKESGEINEEIIGNYLKKIVDCESDCDFVIIILIRVLYILKSGTFRSIDVINSERIRSRICTVLSQFPFWPPDCNGSQRHPNIDNLIFWSENHLLMTLGSAVLFYQYQVRVEHVCDESIFQRIECQLLEKYLNAHCHPLFMGMYEVNSHVYLPYSISALLNLYDFSEDEQIREQAAFLIDRIVYQLMLSTDPSQGIATLSASARAFSRTRLRVFDHNVNKLVWLMNTGINPDRLSPSAVTDFLLTTTWQPKLEAFEALHFDGFMSGLRMTHDLDHLSLLYQEMELSTSSNSSIKDDLIPLCWSAGLITHPIIADQSRSYQRRKGLTNNKHLWPVSYFFFSDVNFSANMEQYEHFSKGQDYTGIRLNVYKKPQDGLVLTSFKLYNPHHCGFQQLPWLANIGGIPIWSQSGLGSESIAGFGIHNTHNPAVQQIEDLMLITYLTPTALSGFIIGSIFSSKVRFFWPVNLFENHVVKEYGKHSSEGNHHIKPSKSLLTIFTGRSTKRNTVFPSNQDELILQSDRHKAWCIGERGNLLVAVLCTKGVSIDTKATKDAELVYTSSGEKITVTIPRLICEADYHSWILVVGSKSDYETIDGFIDQRLSQISIQEDLEQNKGRQIYKIDVLDRDHHLHYHYDLKKREQIIC